MNTRKNQFRLTVVLIFLSFLPAAYPWGGEHNVISEAAEAVLSSDDQAYIQAEAVAIREFYCGFPDSNWPCFGEWGDGTGNPQGSRMPDFRRLWGVSTYCQWDPVLRKGVAYSHKRPQSWQAAAVHFKNAVDCFGQGRTEDGCRFLGVMLHYLQDSGSFSHIQPLHGACHVKKLQDIQIRTYTPQLLGDTPEAAAKAISVRVTQLTAWTEERMSVLFATTGLSLDDARQMADKELALTPVADAVARLRKEKSAEFEVVTTDCANECARVCADAIHTALSFAKKPRVESPANALNTNLVFNASFEETEGDLVPSGWCAGWLDVSDRAGRADWYRARTHWENHVRTGEHSVLLLWAPAKGLEWQQTWPKAAKVHPGEVYRGAARAMVKGSSGGTYYSLEISDTNYKPILTAKSKPCAADTKWQQLSVEAVIPPNARWMRAILHAEGGDGAAWFDDVEVVRLQ